MHIINTHRTKISKTPKVILVFTNHTSFVDKDISLIKMLGCRVLTILSPAKKNIVSFVLNRVKELFTVLIHGKNSLAIISWFNDYHTLIPVFLSKILKTQCLIIVGGYDSISIKNPPHGLFSRNNLRQIIGKYNYRSANRIWVVHQSLKIGCPHQVNPQISSGILNFMPQLETKIEDVPTGYDPTFWILPSHQKNLSVLTVGMIWNEDVYVRKGIPLFIELSKKMPDITFKLIGIHPELSKRILLPQLHNLIIHKPMDPSELLIEYQNSMFYFQGSIVEGLPNVLCEAMLCGCIPIGRSVFGIPDIIGNTGYLINEPIDLESVVNFMKNASSHLGLKARERIMKNYHLNRRVENFRSLLNLSL